MGMDCVPETSGEGIGTSGVPRMAAAPGRGAFATACGPLEDHLSFVIGKAHRMET